MKLYFLSLKVLSKRQCMYLPSNVQIDRVKLQVGKVDKPGNSKQLIYITSSFVEFLNKTNGSRKPI